MATQNWLQKLDGETSFGASAGNRRKMEEFIANDTIAVGDIVAFDTSKTGADRVLYITKAALVANGNGLAVGVSMDVATAGQRCRVVVGGYAESVTAHGAMASGNLLTASGTSAGTVDGRVAADIAPAFGITLEAGANPDCWIYPRY
jgi:hypothetical protein